MIKDFKQKNDFAQLRALKYFFCFILYMFIVFSLMLWFTKHLRILLNNNLHMKCIMENKSSLFLQIKKISYQMYFDLHFLFFM